ncbi:ABC transporter substrate-binding protein [Butyrivibrio sp. INlla16]|uniref:ABC transporter substrate-binding protein n=1 Tax=Butyrivibrio sp. INlla16 TaxID=1520807 RepID=UPI000886B9A0|nr:ABC transporter substrate-binding protein [Butyrivibrio sp. INlla16]SDB39836.1 NitT/TauT family transport system substrate-binding protein [Butyrivibrio sp. INlla16]
MKKALSILCATTLFVSTLVGCGNTEKEQSAPVSEETVEATAEESNKEVTEEAAEEVAEEVAEETTEETEEEKQTEEASAEETSNSVTVRVGSLKGPTTMGLVNLMKDSENGESAGNYEFSMKTQPDEIMAGVVSGDIDIALVPANMASVLYNKTEGGVSLVDINTLGVLYCVTGDESVKSVKDFAGKTVVTTGQGASPEYVLRYLLDKNGVTDCNIEFKSEATEIAALLQEESSKVAILPQPFATVASAKNEAVSVAFDLTDEWDKVSDGSKLLTGVTVVRNDFLNEHNLEVQKFIEEHKASADKAISDVEGTAALVEEYGIIEKKEIAAKALPSCNIVCISGDDAKTALSGYLQVLFDQDPKSVGGNLPDDAFYTLD